MSSPNPLLLVERANHEPHIILGGLFELWNDLLALVIVSDNWYSQDEGCAYHTTLAAQTISTLCLRERMDR